MKTPVLTRCVLGLSGAIGIAVGIASLFAPVPFHESSGIQIGGQVDLLNELRATGGALLALGMLILAGAFLPRLARTSGIVSTLLYASYGSSRALAIAIDGRPSGLLIAVMLSELAIAGALVLTLPEHTPSSLVAAR